MIAVGGTLIYLAIAKEYEPVLLIPIGAGALLANIPGAGMGLDLRAIVAGEQTEGVFYALYKAGISTELFPLLLFIGIGAMTDFSPLLSNPRMVLVGAAGVLFGKLLNVLTRGHFNPLLGAAGISAFPMAARVVQKVAQEEDYTNFLLMQAMGANTAGQIASVIAGGVVLALLL